MPNYTFRDDEQEAAYQVWPRDEQSAFLHPHCAKTPGEREFPLYVDDLREASPDELYCDRCNGEILIGNAKYVGNTHCRRDANAAAKRGF